MSAVEAPVVLHKRVTFGEYGGRGDAHVIVHEGDKDVYFGVGGAPTGGVSCLLTGRISVGDVEAFIALMQEAVDKVRAMQPRCEFCNKPATDERNDRGGRVMPVCDFCAEDHDRAAKRAKDEAAREYAADQAYSEWKDEGRRR